MNILNLIQQRTALLRQNINSCAFVSSIYYGNLPAALFDFYSEQDELYIIDLARVLNLIAARLATDPTKIEASNLLKQRSLLLNQEVNEGFFNPKRTPNFFSHNSANLFVKIDAVEKYTQHLYKYQNTPAISPSLVTILPCYRVYRDIGEHWSNFNIAPNHPYKNWIEANRNLSFIEFGDQLLDLTIQLAKEELKKGILPNIDILLKGYEQSYKYEDELFQASYQGRALLTNNQNLRRLP